MDKHPSRRARSRCCKGRARHALQQPMSSRGRKPGASRPPGPMGEGSRVRSRGPGTWRERTTRGVSAWRPSTTSTRLRAIQGLPRLRSGKFRWDYGPPTRGVAHAPRIAAILGTRVVATHGDSGEPARPLRRPDQGEGPVRSHGPAPVDQAVGLVEEMTAGAMTTRKRTTRKMRRMMVTKRNPADQEGRREARLEEDREDHLEGQGADLEGRLEVPLVAEVLAPEADVGPGRAATMGPTMVFSGGSLTGWSELRSDRRFTAPNGPMPIGRSS